MEKVIRTASLAIGIMAVTQIAGAQGGPVVGWTDHGDAITACLKVRSNLQIAPGDHKRYPVLLAGSGILVIGSALLDESRGVVTVDVDKAKHPDGRDIPGHFSKLAYPINVLNSDGCAARLADIGAGLRHGEPSQQGPAHQ